MHPVQVAHTLVMSLFWSKEDEWTSYVGVLLGGWTFDGHTLDGYLPTRISGVQNLYRQHGQVCTRRVMGE